MHDRLVSRRIDALHQSLGSKKHMLKRSIRSRLRDLNSYGKYGISSVSILSQISYEH